MVSKTTVLYGQYPLTIDEKYRIVLPAEVRRSLDPERDGEAFFIVIGINHKPWLYPERGYESLVSKLASKMSPGEDMLAFNQMHFSMASRVEWDKQGRMLIPELSRRRTELGREISMIGAFDHLELWNRNEWEARQEYLISRSAELAASQRENEENGRGNGQS
jgi:MraZ protein